MPTSTFSNLQPDHLISLIYASSSPQPIPNSELIGILTKAREKNARLNITGMLLYKNGNFLQVLEGPRDAVTELYETIKQDKRHHQIDTILQRPIQQRDFAEWEMGFTNLEQIDPKLLPGYSQFLNTPLNVKQFAENPSFALEFLLAFKEGIR